MKAIIAYFTCSGCTATAAKHIAKATGGTLYEIRPETPYSEADLDWTKASSRSSKEHADASSRPPLAGDLPDFASYDVIYVGFPVWWYEAPRIILTFLEAAAKSLKGKTIVPFCTSHSSPLGQCDTLLHPFVPEAKWLPGKRFKLAPSKDEVAEWVKNLQ